MTLLEEAHAAAGRMGGVCSVQLLRERMTPAEQAELDEAIRANVQAKALSKALAARGWDLPPQTIGRHRRGDCKCP